MIGVPAKHGETVSGGDRYHGLPERAGSEYDAEKPDLPFTSGLRTNMFTFSFFFLVTNVLFLMLGALLYIYAGREGIVLPGKSDDVFRSCR